MVKAGAASGTRFIREDGRLGLALLAGAALHGAVLVGAFGLVRHGREAEGVVAAAPPPMAYVDILTEGPGLDEAAASGTSDLAEERAVHRAPKANTAAHANIPKSAVNAPIAVATNNDSADSHVSDVSADVSGAGDGVATDGAARAGAGNGSGTGTSEGAGTGAGGGKDVTAHDAALVGPPPCDVFFPYSAPNDIGIVAVTVTVNPTGKPGSVVVESESPKGAGFGSAAKSCVSYARFRPATDVGGAAIASIAHLELKFSRRR